MHQGKTVDESAEAELLREAQLGDRDGAVDVDGVQIGGIQTALASHAAGQTDGFTVLGSFGSGPHTVTVDFLNDAYGGTPGTDRNLYVDAIINGGVTSAFDTALYSQGSQNFQV